MQNNGIENEFYACPVVLYSMREYGRLMGLNPEEAQRMERDAVQQKIDEMQQEIEEQRALLEEKAREIAELKKLFNDSGEAAGQAFRGPHEHGKDSLEEVYEIVSGLE